MGVWACIPTSNSSASATPCFSRCSRSWRASSARLSWRLVRTGAAVIAPSIERSVSDDQRRLLDVDHARVEHLFIDLEVVDQRESKDDPVADQLVGDLAVLDFEQDVVGALVIRDVAGVLPRARGSQ